ncbi:MAG: hypothetical protein QHI48_09365, partial [Bacteroidota bacterium]|nr:hypothetical protein [Bacteroidota bacterium]
MKPFGRHGDLPLAERSPLYTVVFFSMLLVQGCNPFAPSIDTESPHGSESIADQSTIEGVFRTFRNAYTFKDTLIYGGLLAHDFLFTYRDYDKLVDQSWGRDEEMRITMRLFDNAQNLNLVWNNT